MPDQFARLEREPKDNPPPEDVPLSTETVVETY
jgi:hypothetical protein